MASKPQPGRFAGRQTLAEKLRLALVIDLVDDWNLGGTERQIAQLVRALDPQKFEAVIFILQPCAGAAAKDLACPVVLVNKAGQSRTRSFLNLRSALQRFQPHIVQTFFIDATFYGTLAAWLNRVPLIVQSRRNAGYWQKPYHTLALRLLNHVVDSWQCNSQYVAGMLEREEGIPRKRIAVLRNFIDVIHFSPASADERLKARSAYGLPADAPVFVVVSTLRPIKGLATVIEAADRLRHRLPSARFVMVGDGPQRSALKSQIARLGLQDMVLLAGGQADVRPWLSVADLGILASHSESSSNALLEYAAMGLPAVVSDLPANREIVSGEFFPAGDAAQLAEKLLWLWDHPEVRARMAETYRRQALQHSPAAFSHEAEAYYLNLAAGVQPLSVPAIVSASACSCRQEGRP